MFTFFVGEKQAKVPVHAAAIAKQSWVLDRLINGHMIEAQTLSASLSDVSEEDFVKFCEFAYTGDYPTSPCTTIAGCEEAEEENSTAEGEPPGEPGPPPPSPPPDEWASWGKKKPKKPSRTALLRTDFDSKSYCPVLPRQTFLDACQVVGNSKCTENYTPVFLGHARLYVLAEKYGVEPLKRLTLHKLHKTLVDFALFEKRMEDIAELVRFSYCNDNTRDGGNDDLRALVLNFVASRHAEIGGSEPFLSLVEECGVFARDFWLFVQENLI